MFSMHVLNNVLSSLIMFVSTLLTMHDSGEQAPDADAMLDYNSDDKRVRKLRHKQKMHKLLSFLDDASVKVAINGMKDDNVYPICVPEKKMPGDAPAWTNIPTALYTFWVRYCNHLGLTQTNPTARTVLLYLFYGSFTASGGRKWPVIRAIHRLVTNGRHRFRATTEKHFTSFFKLLERQPELVKFLNDGGLAPVPMELKCAVEDGLRSHGYDMYAMGTNAMRSKKDWRQVRKWTKREGYIAAVRHKWEKGPYCQWDHFDLQDYIDRQTLGATFENRHLPLSTGAEFGTVVNPEIWSKPVVCPSTQRHRRGRNTSVFTPLVPETAGPTTSKDHEIMIFDPSVGKLVPVSSDSDEDE
jgi:hypothetical protein